MTTEVKQPSFEDLFNKQISTAAPGALFDIKREMEQAAIGGFYCYACTHVKPMSQFARSVGNRKYCTDCYQIIKTEPRTKSKAEDE